MTMVLTGPLELCGDLRDYMGESIYSSAQDVDIQPLSPFRLLLAMGASEESGMLGISNRNETISLAINDGFVTKTASSEWTDNETLGTVLRDERLLAVDLLEEAANQVDETGTQLARVVFERKMMPARDMVQALQRLIVARVAKALGFQTANYTYAHVSVYEGRLVTGATKVMINQILGKFLQEELLNYTAEDIVPYLNLAIDGYLQVSESNRKIVRNLALSERQLHAIETVLDGSQTTQNILQLYTKGLDVMCRLLLTLFIFDMVDVVDKYGDPIK